GVKDRRTAPRAKPKDERAFLIPDTSELGRGAEDLERRGEAGQRRKNAASSTLASEAMTNTHASWLAVHFNTQLSTRTVRCSRCHGRYLEDTAGNHISILETPANSPASDLRNRFAGSRLTIR